MDPRPLIGAGETLYWLPGARTLVSGDSILGSDGGLSVCPQSWLDDVRVNRPELAELLRPLLALPIERVLASTRRARAGAAACRADAGGGGGRRG